MQWKIFVLVVAVLAVPIAIRASDRPNILWLSSEDNTTLLGCYGDSMARTPTLDQLARDGVLFENCFAQPVCAPSRFALITGTFAASSGPANHMRAEGRIPSWMKGFPAFLRRAGYFTTNQLKTDYNSLIRVDQVWNECGSTADYANRADSRQPFFSVYNHEVTHESCLFKTDALPLNFPPTDPAKVRIPSYQPDTPEIRADWARYYDCLKLMDQQIAVKLENLSKCGLADNTIVFYFSDNGGVLPRSKRFLHESGTHVPLIVYFPPKWRHLAPGPPGSRIKTPVSFVDFAPTVLSLAGVEIPEHMQGRAFAGPKMKPNEYVYCTRDRMDERYDMVRSVIDSRWLYIRNFRPDINYVQPLSYMFNARGYRSWERLARDGKLAEATARFWGKKPTEELYEMTVDHDNVHNLANDPAYWETLERMRDALQKHTLEINDNGFLPEGSVLEGYDESRAVGAYPLVEVYQMALIASERNPDNLVKMIEGLKSSSEPIRWWAAQGCAMLGDRAGSAKSALMHCLRDSSGAVQIAAAEALACMGQYDEGLRVLQHWLCATANPKFSLQAANVIDRIIEGPRPVPAMVKAFLEEAEMQFKADGNNSDAQRILKRMKSVVEGKMPVWVSNPQTQD